MNPHAAVGASPGSYGSSEQAESPHQDRFRNASFISRSAILGDDFQDIDHAHPEAQIQIEKVPAVEMKTLKLHNAFDLPVSRTHSTQLSFRIRWLA